VIKKALTIYLPTLVVAAMFLLILFGDKGLNDLKVMKQKKMRIVQQNEALVQQNLAFHQTVMRLKNDLEFIEHTARKDLGLVKENELILKVETFNGNRP
jgi:cell division protein FtsB